MDEYKRFHLSMQASSAAVATLVLPLVLSSGMDPVAAVATTYSVFSMFFYLGSALHNGNAKLQKTYENAKSEFKKREKKDLENLIE